MSKPNNSKLFKVLHVALRQTPQIAQIWRGSLKLGTRALDDDLSRQICGMASYANGCHGTASQNCNALGFRKIVLPICSCHNLRPSTDASSHGFGKCWRGRWRRREPVNPLRGIQHVLPACCARPLHDSRLSNQLKSKLWPAPLNYRNRRLGVGGGPSVGTPK